MNHGFDFVEEQIVGCQRAARLVRLDVLGDLGRVELHVLTHVAHYRRIDLLLARLVRIRKRLQLTRIALVHPRMLHGLFERDALDRIGVKQLSEQVLTTLIFFLLLFSIII